VIRDGRTR